MSNTLGSSDLSDDDVELQEGSILEEDEPRPELRRVSSSSSSSDSSFDRDEAGLITSNGTRPLKHAASPAPEDPSQDASTIVKALDVDPVEPDDEETPLTPRDVNRHSNGFRRPSRAPMNHSTASSAKDKTRQNLTLREQEKVNVISLLSYSLS
jgi:hypothetical protein